MTDLTPNDLSHLSDAEFNALCPQGEHAPGPEPLSHAAQAVRDAALATYDKSIPKDDSLWALDRASVVAALRAAAFHLHSEEYETCGGCSYALMIDVDDLLAIAAELEGANG